MPHRICASHWRETVVKYFLRIALVNEDSIGQWVEKMIPKISPSCRLAVTKHFHPLVFLHHGSHRGSMQTQPLSEGQILIKSSHYQLCNRAELSVKCSDHSPDVWTADPHPKRRAFVSWTDAKRLLGLRTAGDNNEPHYELLLKWYTLV